MALVDMYHEYPKKKKKKKRKKKKKNFFVIVHEFKVQEHDVSIYTYNTFEFQWNQRLSLLQDNDIKCILCDGYQDWEKCDFSFAKDFLNVNCV